MADFKRKRTTGSEGDALTLSAHISSTDPHPYSDYITYQQALDLLGGGGGGGGTSSAELTAHNESTASHAKLVALLTPKTAFDAFANEVNLQLTNNADAVSNHTKAATERHQSKHLGHDGNELYAWFDHSHDPTAIGAAERQHNHEGVYSPTTHNHDVRYALLTHDHGNMYISNVELEQVGIYPSVYKHPGVLNPDYYQISTFENIGMEIPEQMVTNGMYVYAMNDDLWYQATVEEVEDPEDLDNPIRTVEWAEVPDPGIVEYNPLDLNEYTVQGNIYVVDPKNCPISGSVLVNTYVTELTDDVYDGDLLILHGISKVRQICSQESLVFSREATSYTDVVIENEGTDIETTTYTKRYTWTKWTCELAGTRTSDITSEFHFSNGQLIGTVACGESFVHSLQVYINNELVGDWFTNIAGTTNYNIVFIEPIKETDTFGIMLVEKLPSYTNIEAVRSQLSTHSSNTTSHLTATERAKWNGKQDAIVANTFAPYSHVGDATHMTSLEKSTIATGLSKIVDHDLTHLEESYYIDGLTVEGGYVKIGDLIIAYGTYSPTMNIETEGNAAYSISNGLTLTVEHNTDIPEIGGLYTKMYDDTTTIYTRLDENTGKVYCFYNGKFGVVNHVASSKFTQVIAESLSGNIPNHGDWTIVESGETTTVDTHTTTIPDIPSDIRWPTNLFKEKILNVQITPLDSNYQVLNVNNITITGCSVRIMDPVTRNASVNVPIVLSYCVIGK